MSVLSQPKKRSYKINQDWIDQNANNPDAYFDIGEVQNGEGGYIAWLRANVKNFDINVEMAKSNFIVTGIKAGITANNIDTNTAINRQLKDDCYNYISHYMGKLVHDEAVTRIYAYGTTAENIEILGY